MLQVHRLIFSASIAFGTWHDDLSIRILFTGKQVTNPSFFNLFSWDKSVFGGHSCFCLYRQDQLEFKIMKVSQLIMNVASGY